jgi:hypothetical protein
VILDAADRSHLIVRLCRESRSYREADVRWQDVAVKYMAALPNEPSFPVYGLGDGFEGLRWLAIWQDVSRLWSITLGHNRPEDGPWISVETVHKTPRIMTSSDRGSGPTGFGDAALAAMIRLVETSALNAVERTAALRDASRRLSAEAFRLAGWDEVDVNLDGARVPAQFVSWPTSWAVLIDLPTVTIAASEPTGTEHHGCDLQDVTESLSRYL